MIIDVQSKVFGLAATLATHGALLGALMLAWPNVQGGGTSKAERGLVVFDVPLASAGFVGGKSGTFMAKTERRRDSVDVPAVAPRTPGGLVKAPAVEPPDMAAASGHGRSPDLATSPAASASARFSGELASTYQAALFSHVLKYRYYPEDARALGSRGVAQVQFEMTREGRLLGVWIKRSSGSALLDEAALEAVRRAEPLPAVPPQLPAREILLHIDFIPPAQR